MNFITICWISLFSAVVVCGCPRDKYRDRNTGFCFRCSDVCDPARDSITDCQRYCPNWLKQQQEKEKKQAGVKTATEPPPTTHRGLENAASEENETPQGITFNGAPSSSSKDPESHILEEKLPTNPTDSAAALDEKAAVNHPYDLGRSGFDGTPAAQHTGGQPVHKPRIMDTDDHSTHKNLVIGLITFSGALMVLMVLILFRKRIRDKLWGCKQKGQEEGQSNEDNNGDAEFGSNVVAEVEDGDDEKSLFLSSRNSSSPSMRIVEMETYQITETSGTLTDYPIQQPDDRIDSTSASPVLPPRSNMGTTIPSGDRSVERDIMPLEPGNSDGADSGYGRSGNGSDRSDQGQSQGLHNQTPVPMGSASVAAPARTTVPKTTRTPALQSVVKEKQIQFNPQSGRRDLTDNGSKVTQPQDVTDTYVKTVY